MAPSNCTLWNIVSAAIGLIAGSGGTLFVIKIRQRNSTVVTQRDIRTGGGDVAGGDIRKR